MFHNNKDERASGLLKDLDNANKKHKEIDLEISKNLSQLTYKEILQKKIC